MPAVDFVEIALEENPIYENAVATNGTGPNRISTDVLYLPARSAKLSPAPSHLDRADEMRSILGAPAKLIEGFAPAGQLSVRAYAKLLTWIFETAGFKGTVTTGGPTVGDPDTTTATGVNVLNSAVVNVADTSLFPAAGTFVFGGAAVTYTGKTATSFTGCANHAATVGGEVIANNVPATCQMWTFVKRDGIDAKTMQIRLNHKDEAVQLKGNGFGTTQWALNALGEVQATLAGLVLKRLAVDSATVPTYPSQAIPPFRRRELYLSWLAGGGRVGDFSIQGTNALVPVNTLSLLPPSTYPDAMEHGDAQALVTGSIPKRVLNAVDYDALLAASTFAAKARFKSSANILATAYPYSMWIDMPACQYDGGDADDIGNKRRIGASYNFYAAYSEAAGYDVKITVVNDVATINTFP